MSSLAADAAVAGFPYQDTLHVNPAAARLLPSDSPILGVSVAGDVLEAACDYIPTPAELRDLERSAGMLLTLVIVPSDVLLAERTRISAGQDGEAPLALGPVLLEAVARDASDVHLTAGSPPVLRVAGRLEPLSMPAFSALDMRHASTWLTGEDLEGFSGDHDAAVTYAGSRWRVSVYRQRQSLALAIRKIPASVPRLESLGLPPAVVELAELSSGLVLFCGPTGSGKSTSLAALLDRINRTRSTHILTIEDPVEYVHQNRLSIIHQREVGDDTTSFATGLRHALRQDPDVILVGELRDLETMRTALSAAETGHLVLATVHASSTAGAFTRLIDAFPAEQQSQVRTQLASTLQAVVAQSLLPGAAPGTRHVVCEVLVAVPAVRNIVRDDRLHEISSILDSTGSSMTSMDRSLAYAVAQGRITEATARRHVSDPKVYEAHRTRAGGGGFPFQGHASLDDLDGVPL